MEHIYYHTAYLNGNFLPLEDARISPFDRGFMYGDGVYEVIAVRKGVLQDIESHLDRLNQNLAAVRIKNPLKRPEWYRVLGEFAGYAATQNMCVYIQITRGIVLTEQEEPLDTHHRPTVFVVGRFLKASRCQGIKIGKSAVTSEDIRGKLCHLKTVSRLPTLVMQQIAVDLDVDEVILIKNGLVIEGANSSVIVVKKKHIYSPLGSACRLDSTSRKRMLTIAKELKYKIHERDISVEEMRAADEIWLTGTCRGLTPITTLDGYPIGDGKIGTLWQQLTEELNQRHEAEPAPVFRTVNK